MKAKSSKLGNHKLVLRVTIVATILLLLTVICLTYKDVRRHNSLNQSMDKLVATLQQNGFENVQKSSGCGRTQVKYGSGAKLCSVSFVMSSLYSIQEAGSSISSFEQYLIDSNDFTVRQSIGKNVLGADDLGINDASYEQQHTKTICYATFHYDQDTSGFRLVFSCDDTPWFQRDILNKLGL